jgi:hypothetical protein
MCNYINLKASAWFNHACPYGLTPISSNKEIASLAATETIKACDQHYILYDIINYFKEWRNALINVLS